MGPLIDGLGHATTCGYTPGPSSHRLASCVIVSRFRTALESEETKAVEFQLGADSEEMKAAEFQLGVAVAMKVIEFQSEKTGRTGLSDHLLVFVSLFCPPPQSTLKKLWTSSLLKESTSIEFTWVE